MAQGEGAPWAPSRDGFLGILDGQSLGGRAFSILNSTSRIPENDSRGHGWMSVVCGMVPSFFLFLFSRKHGEGFFRWVHLSCSHKSHYKVSLQGIIIMKVIARSHCKKSLQGVIARSHCKGSLQGVMARSHCKESLQGVMARSHCKESWQGVIARSHCKESLQGVIARSHCKESWQGLQLALDSLHLQLALDSLHLQLALD